jgi:hypothetical protein
MEELIMLRPIGLALTAMAALGLTIVNVDDAQARHRRNGGNHGSCGSFGGGGSFGGIFSHNSNGCYGDSYGSNGGHGSCGSHGGAYNSKKDKDGEEYRTEYGQRGEYRSEFDPGQPPRAPQMGQRHGDDRDADRNRNEDRNRDADSNQDRDNEDRDRDSDSNSDDNQKDKDKDQDNT